MNDQFSRILSSCVVVLVCILTAAFVARKSAFYRCLLRDTTQRELQLDGLRGFLALGVLVGHCDFAHEWLKTGNWTSDSRLIVFFGQGAVFLFFMITGYLFWGKAIQGMGKVNPVTMWIGRLRQRGPEYRQVCVCCQCVSVRAGDCLSRCKGFPAEQKIESCGFC